MKVTKEDVEKAKAAYAKADAETVAAYAKASVAAEEAWKKYLKLWREYDNESN